MIGLIRATCLSDPTLAPPRAVRPTRSVTRIRFRSTRWLAAAWSFIARRRLLFRYRTIVEAMTAIEASIDSLAPEYQHQVLEEILAWDAVDLPALTLWTYVLRCHDVEWVSDSGSGDGIKFGFDRTRRSTSVLVLLGHALHLASVAPLSRRKPLPGSDETTQDAPAGSVVPAPRRHDRGSGSGG